VTIRAGLAAEPPFAQGKPSRFHPPTPHRSCRCHPLRPPRARNQANRRGLLSRRMGTTIERLATMPLVGIQFRCPSPRGICSVNVRGLLKRLMRGLGLAWSPPALRRRNRFGLHTQRIMQPSISRHIEDAIASSWSMVVPRHSAGKPTCRRRLRPASQQTSCVDWATRRGRSFSSRSAGGPDCYTAYFMG